MIKTHSIDRHAERLLTVKETAKLWSVSDRTVYRKIWNGELPVVWLTPKTPRIKESVVLSYVESRCFPGASQDRISGKPELVKPMK